MNTRLHPPYQQNLLEWQQPWADSHAAPSTRGIAWVLRWAAVLLVLTVSTVILLRFGYLLIAEQKLSGAARAGIREAQLARASGASVAAVVRQHLAADGVLHPQIRLACNGVPTLGRLRCRQGDEISVSLLSCSRDALPHWLIQLCAWLPDTSLHVVVRERI